MVRVSACVHASENQKINAPAFQIWLETKARGIIYIGDRYITAPNKDLLLAECKGLIKERSRQTMESVTQ